MRWRLALWVPAISTLSLSMGSPEPRALTFEQRVEAQAAIERVYYRHQIGATLPFDTAVPRARIEQKVRDYLK